MGDNISISHLRAVACYRVNIAAFYFQVKDMTFSCSRTTWRMITVIVDSR